MAIDANAVGKRFGERTIEVTARQLLAYAGGIGATDAVTFDDSRPGGLIAVPQFCVSFEWPVVSDSRRAEVLGLSGEEQRGVLHVGQDSIFHDVIRPGRKIRSWATVVEVRATRAGAITVCKVESVDANSGVPIVTTWNAALVPGGSVEGEDRSIDPAPVIDVKQPVRIDRVSAPIARELPHIYSECADIWNPIHTERRVALSVGLPDIILHGTATWAIAGRQLVSYYAGNDCRRLRRLSGRFRAMVVPGTFVDIEHGKISSDSTQVAYRVSNSDGEPAVTDGFAEFAAT